MAAKSKHKGLTARLNAWFIDKVAESYNEQVDDIKSRLLEDLSGRVLEIGPGTGANLKYYPDDIQMVGLDPNPYMQKYLRKNARKCDVNIEILTGKAENIPLDDASVNAVVSTLVLCSVDDPDKSLKEIHRVLKPGGSFIFIEHVAAPEGTWLRKIQRWIRPLWKWLAEGCHTDRDTEKKIRRYFEDAEIERRSLPYPVVSPHIMGKAVKKD